MLTYTSTTIRFLAALLLTLFGRDLAIAEVDFNRQVRPILAEHCYHCHGPDANQRSADLRLDIEVEAKKTAIVSQHASDSPLVQRIESTDPEAIMPPAPSGKTLTETQKNILRQWIDEGAKYSEHWAYQPIGKANQLLSSLPPNDTNTDLPIDRFLLARLKDSNLRYSDEVNRTQFIKRATFDLTGLPPTWNEIEAFANDQSPDAIERLIDRLLESPRYGERWGRHWLDIARYADTHGGAAIGFTSFPFSYTYRDYVIQSINENVPLNRFLIEQIAADQLELPESDPRLAAVGFLTVGMQFRNYHDTIDDQIDVITRGLMGLTVTCARCHDHKFDSIPTTDYYSLYAAIAPSKSPTQLPSIGSVTDAAASQQYADTLKELNLKLQMFVRDQSDIMRARLRMQVGLYLAEMAKGMGEQDTSTTFLSYRTDDIRPTIYNRWLSYLKELTSTDPVFGPWLEMKSWGNISAEDFAKRRDEYLAKITAELDAAGSAPEKLHALREEPPKWNPFVVDSLNQSKPGSLLAVAEVYGKVFAEQQKTWLQAVMDATAEAGSPDKILPDDHPQHLVINSPSHRQLRHHLYSPGTPFDVSDDEALKLTNRTINDLISAKRGAIHQLNLSSPGSPPRAMILREDPKPKDTFVFLRGNPLARGDKVEPRFIHILSRENQGKTFENGKRRLGLAKAIVAESNPLTRRVLINWVWQNHFGLGLVRTPDDFGTRGQPPTHPELLDYLADELANHGWSLKWLHREIMLSKAYRQGAIENDSFRQIDPDNQLLWRMPRRRLDFESMRDAMLSVSEDLDLTMGGRPIDLNTTPTIPRRSVYGFTNRDIIANLMSTFDTANPNACTAKRPETTVPQQTLFALNSDFIQDRAKRVATIVDASKYPAADHRATAMMQRILGRSPNEIELTQIRNFLAEQPAPAEGTNVDPEAKWTQLAHALLASNEFIFLD